MGRTSMGGQPAARVEGDMQRGLTGWKTTSKEGGQGDSGPVGAGGHTAAGLLSSLLRDSPRLRPHRATDPPGCPPPSAPRTSSGRMLPNQSSCLIKTDQPWHDSSSSGWLKGITEAGHWTTPGCLRPGAPDMGAGGGFPVGAALLMQQDIQQPRWLLPTDDSRTAPAGGTVGFVSRHGLPSHLDVTWLPAEEPCVPGGRPLASGKVLPSAPAAQL